MAESISVKYLIVGGGAAGANAAVGIRELDTEGSVLLVGKEKWWPYDHPPLSKSLLMGRTSPEDAESKDPSWYEKNNVEVKRVLEAVSLNTSSRTVEFADDSTVTYEKLLLATGSSPKPLGIKGEDLEGVHLFRKIEDSLDVRDAFKTAKKVVLVGASYIGVEVGSCALANGLDVTFVDPGDRPLPKGTSPESGKFVASYLERKGAKVMLQEEVASILGENRVEGVVTKSGIKLECDLLVVGVGVQQHLELAESAGLELDPKHGVVVNEYLRTQDPDVYVAGDIAAFQDLALGKRWHAEHQLNAKWQGKQAGRNMAGAGEPYDRVPYFFSDFLDIHMILRGDPQGGKSAKILGDLDGGEFIELFAREDGALAMGLAFSHDEPSLDKISDKFEELFRAKAVVASLTDSDFSA
jgi:3-phenylpropionate/trans-cinnamate dioxygenase ferredoxin reductase subunit